jgi:hypothetical protein
MVPVAGRVEHPIRILGRRHRTQSYWNRYVRPTSALDRDTCAPREIAEEPHALVAAAS